MKQILIHLVLGTIFFILLYLVASWSFVDSIGSGIALAVVLTMVDLLIKAEPSAPGG